MHLITDAIQYMTSALSFVAVITAIVVLTAIKILMAKPSLSAVLGGLRKPRGTHLPLSEGWATMAFRRRN